MFAIARARWRLLRRWKVSYAISLFLVLTSFYVLYEVQYKTGIELLPFVPIDDSGFEIYNETLTRNIKVSVAARTQSRQGSILCWVMTTAVYHKTRLRAINSTWLRRCDAQHILTNSDRFLDDFTPYHTIFSELPDSYFKLFWKTRLALYYVYTNISSEYDWYYKADDDTYVVMENLRSYLATFDPNEPHYIGFRLKRRMKRHGYNAGGSGYIMSRSAMKVFSEQLFHEKTLCPYHEWEDFAVARCLASVGIYPKDSRDEKHRQRFLPWKPEEHYNGDLIRPFLMDPLEHWGSAIFHENLIGMHHLDPSEIRLIDGLLYGVAPGIWNRNITS
ncbi:unnamed protein product [Nippostrongylus brasiliensis]|uniref:N-acetylgalactosaminide beta-1,3-galactosyltransferase n=1 Tax=Nippostrongylus brasiliensis TaxID=27835 RepID=A0A0N4Y4U5_NIPBR|nr:hypothetical protein Q1695_005504 [Nippostrongylus brasiliensis]VDL74541.1 unnamed protein product [Nippostrongylus brasiliensis]